MSTTRTLHLGAELAGRVQTRINVKALHQDLQRPFRFLFAGDPGLVAQLRASLLSSYLNVEPTPEAARLLETLAFREGQTLGGSDIRCIIYVAFPGDPGPPIERLASFKVPIIALVVDAESAPTLTTSAPVQANVETLRVRSLQVDDLQVKAFPYLLECCRGAEVAVGRRLPILREAACAQLIRSAAGNALKIGAASAVVEQLPILGFVMGAFAIAGDTVAISVVQMNVLLRIGAVFGRDPEMRSVWELIPIIGGGLGWRALSRELAGFIPAAGIAIKGAIAYAGTVVVGEGAVFYYRTGRHMSAADARKLYQETKRAAIELARELAGRLRGKR